MDETRVGRYKEYRESFIKEGSISGGETSLDLTATTSTLPMDKVINAVQEEEKKNVVLQKQKKKANIKLILKIIIGVLIVAGLVVLGIFAWGKK